VEGGKRRRARLAALLDENNTVHPHTRLSTESTAQGGAKFKPGFTYVLRPG
jgi:hypothetical protein